MSTTAPLDSKDPNLDPSRPMLETNGNKQGSNDIQVDPGNRQKWARKIDFIFAAVGYAVGLGNVWRFPYLCYKNGGGAFLIPYVISVVVLGFPMLFLDTAIGQFMSEGATGAWNMCPLFRGIGYASTIILAMARIFYIVILAWSFYYLFASFTTELPWASCNNTWNTENCFEGFHGLSRQLGNETDGGYDGSPPLGSGFFNGTKNDSVVGFIPNRTFVNPATEYWERKVLQISSGITDTGTLRWELVLCLMLAWVLTYFCIWKGVRLSGKVMYVTATLPYALLTALLIRGATLPGSANGVKYYIVPEWKRLTDLNVWVDAATQVFFSYGTGLGSIISMASFNQWNHNCWRDVIIATAINSATSIYAGFAVFSVLGFMAFDSGVGISEVAESGPGLVFITYPTAVTKFSLAPLWSVLFFLMLISLGIDSQFVGMECLVTAISDEFPQYLRGGHRPKIFAAVLCVVSMLMGLTMVTNGGMYVFQLLDYYAANKLVIVVAVFQCVVITWVYGINRFYDNVKMMLGYRLNAYVKICLMGPTPVLMVVLLGVSFYSYSEVTYNRTYIYPDWAVGIGWVIATSSVVWIPGYMAYKVIRERGPLLQRLKKLTRPRLRPHQMRPGDDPRDLIHYDVTCMMSKLHTDDSSVPLKNVAI